MSHHLTFHLNPKAKRASSFSFSLRDGDAYSEERDSDNDAPVLGARQLVDGVADVAVVLLGGTAEAGAGGDSFGGHCCCVYVGG
jgi:hypothetical protein